jgi:hypothetical protein
MGGGSDSTGVSVSSQEVGVAAALASHADGHGRRIAEGRNLLAVGGGGQELAIATGVSVPDDVLSASATHASLDVAKGGGVGGAARVGIEIDITIAVPVDALGLLANVGSAIAAVISVPFHGLAVVDGVALALLAPAEAVSATTARAGAGDGLATAVARRRSTLLSRRARVIAYSNATEHLLELLLAVAVGLQHCGRLADSCASALVVDRVDLDFGSSVDTVNHEGHEGSVEVHTSACVGGGHEVGNDVVNLEHHESGIEGWVKMETIKPELVLGSVDFDDM